MSTVHVEHPSPLGTLTLVATDGVLVGLRFPDPSHAPDTGLNMIDHLVSERGFDRQQAYAICSVAVDLRISELPDVPNMIVTAILPLDILA